MSRASVPLEESDWRIAAYRVFGIQGISAGVPKGL
jgi:hypothetical protein